MIIEEIFAKSLAKRTVIEDWWWTEASMNPYRGCYHDCVYCDGKSEGYYMHNDFGNRIKVKINSPSLLEVFLRKQGYFPVNRANTSALSDFFPESKEILRSKQPPKYILGIGGGVCDVYQPAENKTRVTRKLLEIARDYDFPVQILTKNDLVLRDIDILQQLPYANIAFSITLCNEKDRKIIEPKSSSTVERFNAMNELLKSGIHSGALFLPILPWIGDTSDNLECLYSRAKDAGAEYAIPGGLTLKPGRNKEQFFDMLDSHYPSLTDQYRVLYGNDNKYGSPDNKKAQDLEVYNPAELGYNISKKNGISYRMPRYIPEGRLENNLLISTTLYKISYLKHVLPPYLSYMNEFRKAATFIENYRKNISILDEKELKLLPFTEKIFHIVIELIETGQNNYLHSIGEFDNLFYSK